MSMTEEQRQRLEEVADEYPKRLDYDEAKQLADDLRALLKDWQRLKARLEDVRGVLDPLGAVKPEVTEAELASSLWDTTNDYGRRLDRLRAEREALREAQP